MDEQTNERLKEIKRSFRLKMDGAASRSMREKGLDYKLNWGVGLPELKAMAQEYGKDYDLAIALWKEDIRECKILATLLMPPTQMPREVVDIWMEQTHSQEMVEIAAFHLYQHLDYAPVIAYEWMASDDNLRQMAAYLILARIFSRMKEPNDRGINEFLDQVLVALQSEHAGLKHAAMNCVMRFSELGDEYANMARKALCLDFL